MANKKHKKLSGKYSGFLAAGVLLFGLAFSAKALSPSFSTEGTGTRSNPGTVVRSKDSATATHASVAASSKPANTSLPSKRIAGVNQKRYYLLALPNDYGSEWYLPAVNAPAAWDITTGSDSVVVADIDTGFALSHEDLADHWYYNPGESGGGKETNGIDDDSNGYVDDFRGWDFVPYTYANDPGDNNPQAGVDNPGGEGTTHGSETAGLIGAVGNNGTGTTAIAQNVSVMPLQVIDDNGDGYSDDVAEAITYAVDNGADVINMSLGTSGNDPVVEAAVDDAIANDIVVVAAAGNCGVANSPGPCSGQPTGYITFPANYNKVIAVGATTSSGARASFSSYGERLDVVAPGSGSITSTSWSSGSPTNTYATTLYGTSFASPIVSSSVALVKAIRPSTNVDDIRALVMAGATKLSNMSGSVYTTSLGHGLLNAGKIATVASDLNTSGEEVTSLLQAGGPSSEHTYGASSTIGSGCEGSDGTWCTVWLRNDASNYERFLPYTKIGASGKVGWNFTSAALNHGLWETRSRVGETVSDTPYYLFRK